MTTDGCPTVLGYISLMRKIAPHVKYKHCIIHRGSLASETYFRYEIFKTNSRLFKVLCEEMDSIHLNLLLHAAVRKPCGISCGKVLFAILK